MVCACRLQIGSTQVIRGISTASAQCFFDAGVYAHLYDNGIDFIETYGAGWDGSWCSPPVCGHTYTLQTTLWFNYAAVGYQTFEVPEGAVGYSAIYPGWAAWDATFEIECSRAGAIPVGSAGGSQQVQRYPIPTDELTTSTGNWTNGGVHWWRMFLLPSATSFYGRLLNEENASPALDTCHFENSEFAHAVGVTGENDPPWVVQATNVWGDDGIGWFANAVVHYRNTGRAPCHFTGQQRMKINIPNAPSVGYIVQAIEGGITPTTVWSARGSQIEIRPWP